MLQYMRKNANSTIVWLIIGAIAVVFIFFGVGSGGGRSQMISINGQDISIQQYEMAVKNIAASMGNDYSPETEKTAKLQAVSQLVQSALVDQFGRKIGFWPSDKAVARKIAEKPEFQVDGRFDKNLYQDRLAAGRISPAFFEQSIGESILSERSADLIIGLSSANLAELVELLHARDDKMEFDYAFFPSAPHKDGLVPSEVDLTGYYTIAAENWRKPATMKLTYVELKPEDFAAKVEVSPAELDEYYENNRQRFETQETVEVSHILIKFPGLNPSAEDREKAREKAQAIFERAQTEDFASLAKAVSDDSSSAENGGLVGPITRGMTFAQFENAAFSLPVGEVSQPVETDLGFHLIKVDGHQAAGVKSLEEVRATLTEELKKFKARELAVAALEDLINRAETSALADAASSLNFSAKVTDTFTQDNAPAFLTANAEFLKKAFSAPLGKTAAPIEAENFMVLYEPLERQESFVPPLADIKDQVTTAWIEAQADLKARQAASDFLAAAAKDGWDKALAASSKNDLIKKGRSEQAGRTDMVSVAPFEVVDSLEMMAAAHSVAEVDQVSPHPVSGELKGQRGAYALKLAKLEKADEAQLQGALADTLVNMLTMEKANLLFSAWQGQLYEISKNKIIVPPAFIE